MSRSNIEPISTGARITCKGWVALHVDPIAVLTLVDGGPILVVSATADHKRVVVWLEGIFSVAVAGAGWCGIDYSPFDAPKRRASKPKPKPKAK